MKSQIIVLIFFIGFSSCSQRERSEIERVTIDQELLTRIRTTYTSSSVDTPRGYDFYRVEIYEVDSTRQNLVFKDSLDNILSIRMKENDLDIFVQEFYSNGQVKGKTDFAPGKIDGPAKYYYQDGRVKAIGQWQGGERTGTWKWFEENGLLRTTAIFDENGHLIKSDTVE